MVKCTEECAAATAAAVTRRFIGEVTAAAVDDDDTIIVPSGEPPGGGMGGMGGGGSVYGGGGGGFRLCGGGGDAASAGERESGTSASVYSFYKQRIDAMFDETRSQISLGGGGVSGGRQTLYHRLESEEEKRQRKINNSVQARIERMFVEMAGGDGRGVGRGVGGGMRFAVDYLGSVGLRDKVTSLQGLQLPLADLYFAYCRLREAGGTGECLPANGTLEISGSGLKVHHGGGPDQTELEQLNPFPTIAVWAAVKFVSRARASDGAPEFAFLPLIADPDAVDKGALFRPLAAADRRAVAAAAAAATTPSTPGGGDPSCAHHAPLLAVVMRKLGVSKQLECHGFVCARSEDAVVIAANLYQALMAFMQARQRTKQTPGAAAKSGPKNRNGISYVSVASSSVAGDQTSSPPEHPTPLRLLKPRAPNPKDSHSVVAKCDFPEAKDSLPLPKRQPSIKIPPPIPVRPPRRKTKSSASSTSEDGEEPIVIQQGVLLHPHKAAGAAPTEGGGCSSSSAAAGAAPSRARHSRSESEPCAGAVTEQLHASGLQHAAVRRTASDLHSYTGATSPLPPLPLPFSDAPDGGGGGGDILTKVAIPRSRSFLNAGGPLTRYGRRQSMGPGYGGGNGCGGGGGGGNGSPLGFKELFAEFRVQEGLHSMDDILGAIIDAEGMSFNDLKPIYKEFLLKLAVTLTKDELYQRSKSIMRRQRKKNRRKGAGCVNRKKSFTSGGGGGIKRVFRRSVGKLKQSKPRPQSFEFTSVLFPSSVPLRASKKIRGGGFSVESSTTSTSSYSARNFHLRGGGGGGGGSGGLPSRRPSGGGSSSQAKRRGAPSRRRPQPPSASEDSDFFSLARASAHGGTRRTANTSATTTTLAPHNRSSSGYFSCSECSYDSESCTCTSADKCYCSQGEGKHRAAKEEERAANHRTLSSCGCDTDSCLDSDKCYCSSRDPAAANAPSAHHHHRRIAVTKSVPPPAPALAGASVFDQLKQRGFPVSDATSPHRHRRRQAPPPPLGGVRPAKSMEILGPTNASSARTAALQTRRTRSDETGGGCGVGAAGAFGRRMDVYAQPPRAVSRRSHSSDNLVVDYDLFTTSSRSEAEDALEAAAAPSDVGRVLVVSARDPRGRIVCMGASCRSDAGRGARAPLPGAAAAPSGTSDGSGAAASSRLRRSRRAAAAAAASASEALSVKKSAEIAAVFSDMKVQAAAAAAAAAEEVRVEAFASTKDMFYSGVPLQQSSDYYFASRASVKSYLGSSLENSLGYLP